MGLDLGRRVLVREVYDMEAVLESELVVELEIDVVV